MVDLENESLAIKVEMEKNRQISHLLTEKKKELDQVSQKNIELEAEIKHLKEVIGQLESKTVELEASKRQLGEINQLLEQKDQAIEKLSAQNSKLSEQIENLQNEIQQLNIKKEEDLASPEVSASDLMDTTHSNPEFVGDKKLTCPKCNSTHILGEKDKSKIVYMAAGSPIYAKIHRCLKCNHSWSI